MKKIFLVFFMIVTITCLCACQQDDDYVFVYSGDDADLYTEVIHSIPGIRGYYRIPELGNKGNRDPYMEVLEQDEYGRKLFIYIEGNDYYLLIAQKTEDVIYYYPDYNFMAAECDPTKPQDASTEESGYSYYYSDPDKYYRCKISDKKSEELKIANDWGKEFHMEKCVRQTITRQKDDPLTNKEKNALYKEVFGTSHIGGDYYAIKYLTKDDEGKLLYIAVGNGDDRMVIVNDGEQRNKIITNMTDCQEELANFKRENDWKKS